MKLQLKMKTGILGVLLAALLPVAAQIPPTADALAAATSAPSEAPAFAETDGLLLPVFESKVAAPSQGIVEEILVKEGQPVKEGQILLKLNTQVQMLQLDLARATFNKVEGELDAAKRLHDEKLISRDEVNRVKLEFARARAELTYADLVFDKTQVRAPADGFVLRILKKKGESAQQYEHVADVVSLDRVLVTALLPKEFLGRVKPGQNVEIHLSGETGADIMGKVELVDPLIDAGTEVFRVKVTVDNKSGTIAAGTRASIKIPLAPIGKP